MPVGPNRIIWISHRGVTERAVENTRIAFQDAVAAGFDTLETDLLATRDGVIVLAHDDDLSHVSASPRRISELNDDELAAIELRDGQRILRFDEFVDGFAGQRWLLDIKPETSVQVVDLLADRMQDSEFASMLRERARFLFWSGREQRYGQTRLPGIRCTARQTESYRAGIASFLGLPWLGGIEAGKTYGLTATFKGLNLFTPRVFDAYHSRGARVLAYLPTTRREIERAIRAGADEVILDFAYDRMRSTPQQADE